MEIAGTQNMTLIARREDKMKKTKLYVLIGCPGCGKSTWSSKMCEHDKSILWVSRDVIRFRILKPTDGYFTKEKEVYANFVHIVANSLFRGQDTIADATHLDQASRSKLYSQLRAKGINFNGVEVIGVYFDVPFEVCVSRNATRTGRRLVPYEQMIKMFKKLTKPSRNEWFDKVIVINEEGEIVK